MTDRVLITGARAPAALDLARSFGAAGFEVHLADSRTGLMGRWSGVARAMHRYASPAQEPDGFRRDIGRLADDLRPDLIVPVCEEVFHLAQAAPELGLEDILFAPSPDVLDQLHSKARFIDLCDALGLAAPTTHRLVDRADVAAVSDQSERRVFKAEYSRFGADALVGPSAARLAKVRPTLARPWVVQERIEGWEACCYAVAVAGELAVFSAYGSPWRMSGGAGYAFAPLDEALSAQLMAIAELLAQVVGTGQFACDLIVDADNRPWLIECNPRATSGVHLFGGRRDLAHAFMRRPARPVIGRDRGRLGPAMWRYGLPMAIAQGRLADWSDERREAPDVITRGQGCAAAVGAVLDTLAYSAHAMIRGGGLERAMTYDIEWNGPGGVR